MLWRGQLLRRALRGWSAVFPIQKEENSKMRLACRHAELHFLCSGYHAWVQFKAIRTEKNIMQSAQVAEARAVLSGNRRARIFAAWTHVHRQNCLKRVKLLRGICHCNARTLLKATHAWQMWLFQKRRTQSLMHAADQHFAKRRLGMALERWQQTSIASIESRAKKFSAVHLWATQMQWKALKWWKEYIGIRRKKKTAMENALNNHHVQLQKEGAAQWLRVGLWRRDQRVNARAEEAARKAREDVINAEKFSRKWRHLVRPTETTSAVTAIPSGTFSIPGMTSAQSQEDPHKACVPPVSLAEPEPVKAEIWPVEMGETVGHAEVFDHASWTNLSGSACFTAPERFSCASSLRSHAVSTCGSLLGKARPKPRRPLEILGQSALANSPLPHPAGMLPQARMWEHSGQAPAGRSPPATHEQAGGRGPEAAPPVGVAPTAPAQRDYPADRAVAERIHQLQQEIHFLQTRQYPPPVAPRPR